MENGPGIGDWIGIFKRRPDHFINGLCFLVIVLLYSLEQANVLNTFVSDHALSLILIFLATYVYQTIVNEWMSYKRGLRLDEIDTKLGSLQALQQNAKMQMIVQNSMLRTGLENVANEVVERLNDLTTKKSYKLRSIYATFSLIYDLKEATQPGDEFWGFSSILGEWDQDLSHYHELGVKKASLGVQINRYFMIPRRATPEHLRQWSEVMRRQQQDLHGAKICFVLEKDLLQQPFLRFVDEDGHVASLLRYVEFGLFKYNSKSAVLVYRRGVNEHDLQTDVTCDPDIVDARNIFDKIPAIYVHPYVDEESFLKVCQASSQVEAPALKTATGEPN